MDITRKLRLIVPAFTLLAGLCIAPVHAWNGTGHMAVAGIAYDHLTPKTKAAVDALLMRQKDYGRWISQMPAGYIDRARFAFMKAATWPDEVRKTPDDRPLWHYKDIPLLAPGYTADPVALLPIKPNAETQIGAETRLLTAQMSPTANGPSRSAGSSIWSAISISPCIRRLFIPLHFPKATGAATAKICPRHR